MTDGAGIEVGVVDVSVRDGIEIGETSADVSVIHGAEIQVSSDVQMNNVTDDFNVNKGDLKEERSGQSDENNNDSGVYVLNEYEII